jgi:hypothetical protein
LVRGFRCVFCGKASEAVATVDELFNVEEQVLILRHGRKAERLETYISRQRRGPFS